MNALSARPSVRARLILAALMAAALAVTGVALQAGPAAADPVLIARGDVVPVTLTPGQSVTYAFDLQAGQRPGFTWMDGTTDGTFYVELRDPAGDYVEGDTFSAHHAFHAVTQAGRYSYVLTYQGGGAVDLHLRLDIGTTTTQTLVPGSATTAVQITHPGDDAVLSFPGTAGQKVTVEVTAVDLHSTGLYPPDDPRGFLELAGPNGSFQWIGDVPGPVSFPQRLDATGTWKLRLSVLADLTGTITLRVVPVPVRAVAITPGTATTITFGADGADVRATFALRAGGRLTASVLASNLTSATGDPQVQATVLAPDGSEFWGFGTGSKAFYDPSPPITRAGTYTLRLSPSDGTTGSVRLAVNQVKDSTANLTVGVPAAVSLAAPGQNAVFSFKASAGQRLKITLAGQRWTSGRAGGSPQTAGVYGVLRRPDGVENAVLLPGEPAGGTDVPLVLAGTYQLTLDGQQDTTGSALLTVGYASTTTRSLTLGKPTTATFGYGDALRYQFSATAGRRLFVGLQRPTLTGTPADDGGPRVSYDLLDPSGQVLRTGTVTTGPSLIETEPLTRGTYTLALRISPGTKGSMVFTSTQPVDSVSALRLGARTTAKITAPGQRARYTFTGTAGRNVTLETFASTFDSPNWADDYRYPSYRLIRPDGTLFQQLYPIQDTADHGWTDLANASPDTLDVTGTWTLEVDPGADAVGSQPFVLDQPVDVRGTAALDTPVPVSLTTRGQKASYTFTKSGDGDLFWSVTGSTVTGTITFVAADGTRSADIFWVGDRVNAQTRLWSGPGTYTVVIDPAGSQTGSLTLNLSETPPWQ